MDKYICDTIKIHHGLEIDTQQIPHRWKFLLWGLQFSLYFYGNYKSSSSSSMNDFAILKVFKFLVHLAKALAIKEII